MQTKEIRLTLLRGAYEAMCEQLAPYEPRVSFIRDAISREVRRRASRGKGQPEEEDSTPTPPPQKVPPVIAHCLEAQAELISDVLKPGETLEKFTEACLKQGLKMRLRERLQNAGIDKPAQKPQETDEEILQTTACSPEADAPQEPTTTAEMRAAQAAALLRARTSKK